jgi:hypothetical protein
MFNAVEKFLGGGYEKQEKQLNVSANMCSNSVFGFL